MYYYQVTKYWREHGEGKEGKGKNGKGSGARPWDRKRKERWRIIVPETDRRKLTR